MDYFPINIAQGKAFCNRVEERHLLKKLIMKGRHTVIIAPRRYGKTSLINQTLHELDYPFVIMELTMAVTLKDVEQIVIKSVGALLYSILPTATKAKQKILNLFKWLNPEVVLSAKGQKIIFHPDWSKLGQVSNIAEILKKLDEAAAIVNKRVVIVMDEFQQLSEIGDPDVKTSEYAIEAGIRNAMQYCQNTSYIFSGSHRQMLLSMFNGKSRPFYNSCEIMTIDRIDQKDYQKFIQDAAIQQWKKPIPDEVLQKIFELTELHPNYINRLCGYFWLLEEFPTLDKITQYWDQIVQSKKSEFTEDVLSLSRNQKKLLSHIVENLVTQPGSAKVTTALGLSEASTRLAMKVLLEKDFIYQTKEGVYRILDPAMRDMLKQLI